MIQSVPLRLADQEIHTDISSNYLGWYKLGRQNFHLEQVYSQIKENRGGSLVTFVFINKPK